MACQLGFYCEFVKRQWFSILKFIIVSQLLFGSAVRPNIHDRPCSRCTSTLGILGIQWQISIIFICHLDQFWAGVHERSQLSIDLSNLNWVFNRAISTGYRTSGCGHHSRTVYNSRIWALVPVPVEMALASAYAEVTSIKLALVSFSSAQSPILSAYNLDIDLYYFKFKLSYVAYATVGRSWA